MQPLVVMPGKKSADGRYYLRYPGGDAIPQAQLAFSFADFSGAPNTVQLNAQAAYGGSAIELLASTGNPHTAGSAWYKTAQNIQSFTADFTFQVVNALTASLTAGSPVFTMQNNLSAGTQVAFCGDFGSVTGIGPNTYYYVSATGLSSTTFQVSATNGGAVITPGGSGTASPKINTISGITFCVQNSNQPAYGSNPINASADANVCGYGSYDPVVYGSSQQPIINSIAVKFDINFGSQYSWTPTGFPSSTGLYINGGIFNGLEPANDLTAYGIDFHLPHVFAVKIVYDGSVLTMTIKDTTTGAQARQSWPVDIPTCVGANTAYVGLTGGQVTVAGFNVLSWDYYTGYNERLAAPTFSVASGYYSSSQSVSISGPSGASIYYTTDGLEPTTSSTLYTGAPIAISQNTVLKAVAIQSAFTDSLVATASYQIGAAGTNLINFPSGFAGYAGLLNLVGRTTLSGSSLILTDGTNPPNYGEVGNAWFAAPVDVSTFACDFQFNLNAGNARGLSFVMQNQPPASSDGSIYVVSGGPLAIGVAAQAMGFSNQAPSNGTTGGLATAQWAGLLNSVALYFAPINGSGSYIGLSLDGALPTVANSIDVSGTLNFQSGHAMNVAMTYDGTTLSGTITDSVTSAQFPFSFTVDIPGTVGGSTAFVGFGAGSYGGDTQQVNSLTFGA